jgi:hypothetical protein
MTSFDSGYTPLTSTYVDPNGKGIKHINDGDKRVYMVTDPSNWNGSKKNLKVVGFEDPDKNYKPGQQYQVYDPLGEIKNNPLLSSNGGRQNIRDDGLRDLNNEQLQKKLQDARRDKDKPLIKRLEKEEKARGLRNQQKRNNITEPDSPVSNHPGTKMGTPAKVLTVGTIVVGVFYLIVNSIFGHGSGGD